MRSLVALLIILALMSLAMMRPIGPEPEVLGYLLAADGTVMEFVRGADGSIKEFIRGEDGRIIAGQP